VLCITWWFPVSERDISGVLVHRIYFWPYVYGESGYIMGWMSMCTVLCDGPPPFHCISLVLRITMLLSAVRYTPVAAITVCKLLLMMDANCVRNM